MRGWTQAARRWSVGLAVMALGLGCGTPPTNPPEDPPIDVPKHTWSWVDFANSRCDEGTPTGIGANLTDSKNLVIFFNGGGACWDSITCLRTNTSTHGPFTQAQFNLLAPSLSSGTLFDRTLTNNPYKDWNHFFIPYCTGDLHIGSAEAVYTDGSVTTTFHHRGRTNAEAFIARIATTVPNPEQVLVTGVSAGGYGATLNYALVRSTFPNAKVFLLNDSGPLLRNDAIRPDLRAAWANAWKYDAVLNAIDPAVKNDFSALYTVLARDYPNDRMALLSSLQDQTIRTYLGLSPTAFQSALQDLDAAVLDPLPRTRVFLTSGQGHTLLLKPTAHSTKGVTLLDWLQRMQSSTDLEWQSVRP